eukprot:scaffold24777_cov96-Isochrysis_galbana.AAC.3
MRPSRGAVSAGPGACPVRLWLPMSFAQPRGLPPTGPNLHSVFKAPAPTPRARRPPSRRWPPCLSLV